MALWINNVLQTGTPAVAERVASFAEARNAVLADNVANIDTPGYKTRDLSVAEFQKALAEAATQSRETGSPLKLKATRNMSVGPDGRPTFQAVETDGSILFHDGGNRNVEREMSEIAKNALLYRVAIEVLRKQNETLEAAIREKI